MLRVFSTTVAGAVDMWLGVPTGTALGLPPPLVWLAVVTGNLVMVGLAFLIGGRLGPWIYRNRWLSKRRKRVERVWERYGVVGVAIQAPLLTGTPTAAVVALALGAPRRPLLRWMVLSVMFWGAVLTGVAAAGFSVLGLSLLQA